MADKKPFIISVVSGKGGVGKTTISSNIAYIVSQIGKTVLIDFDIHNQGATGLFLPTGVVRDDSISTYSIIAGKPTGELAPVLDNLYFMPSVTPFEQVSQIDIALFLSNEINRTNVGNVFDFVSDRGDIDFVVIDCHGGIDFLSLEAFLRSDEVLVVTEFDSVTFNGTLELMRFYFENAREDDGPAVGKSEEIKLLVNRVETSHQRSDILQSLKRIYDSSISGALRYRIVDLIPSEQLIASSFGEYPFFVELAPSAVFSAKMRLVCHELLQSWRGIHGAAPEVGPMASEKTRNKTRKLVASYATTMADKFRKSFVLSMVGAMMFMLIVFFAVLAEALGNTKADLLGILEPNYFTFIWLAALYLFFGIYSFHFVSTCISARRHFIIEYQYSNNLLAKMSGDQVAVIRLNTLINRSIRVMIWPAMFIFSVFSLTFLAAVVGLVIAFALEGTTEFF